jgi:hypothetical protein
LYFCGRKPNKKLMVRRDLYLNQLWDFVDKPFIKVLTGIRRSGKSSVLSLIRDELQDKGIDPDRIIYLDLESFEFADLSTFNKLYEYVRSKISGNQRHYVLLDEIQEVDSWEKAVNALQIDFTTDIYITGSNSHLLSSELATYLAGRYIDIHIQTLSFAEYLFFKQKRTNLPVSDRYTEFRHFLRLGGFPVLHTGDYTFETAYKVVFDIYSSAILRDTVQRFNIRDVELLERVVKFVFENLGNKFSAKNVADYFKSQQRKIDLNTVYNYLYALEGAFIIYRIPRYDIKGKEILKTLEKYYLSDQSLLYAVLGYKDRLISGVLENIVMLELKRRGYKVFVGKSDDKEIDFIAELKDRKVYIQVSYQLSEKSTIDREFSPLLEIRDNYPKYVVTMDETWKDNIEGIQHRHIADFLLMNEY